MMTEALSRRRCGRPAGRLCGFLLAVAVAAGLPASSASAAAYALSSGQGAVGAFGTYAAREGDVFADLARRFDVGYPELRAANPGVDPWLPGAGRRIVVPSVFVLPDAPHQGIVVNLAQWRLYYFPPGGGQVVTYPLGLGVIGKKTPLGATRVTWKEPNPTWYPPPSIRAEEPGLPAAVPPGPDNPLGAFALHLGWPSYLLHGTNKPDGVGRNVSHGCIRLYPEDIAQLFGIVPVGTPVRVVNQPATAGWYGGSLYLAVYPNKEQVYQIDTEQAVTSDPLPRVEAVVREAAGQYAGMVDWEAVRRAAQERTGMAVRVGGLRDDRIATQAEPGGSAPPAYSGSSQSGAGSGSDHAARSYQIMMERYERAYARDDGRSATGAAAGWPRAFYDGESPNGAGPQAPPGVAAEPLSDVASDR